MSDLNQPKDLDDEILKPIQRIYKGIKFRSTLETKWAIFFDMMGWKWVYEPLGLKNTEATWFPDFLIYGYDNKRILVEVKPFSSFQQFEDLYNNKYDKSLSKTEFEFDEVLLLGNKIFEKCSVHQGPQLGWLVERHKWLDKFETFSQVEQAVFWHKDQKFGFASDTSSWHCRITNNYNGGAGIQYPTYIQVFSLWIEAGKVASSQPVFQGEITWSENITSV